MNRPGGVTVIAVLWFIAGAGCTLIGLLAMLGGGIMTTLMSQSGAQGSAAASGILGALGAALGIVVLLFAVLYIVTGWGMLKLKPWARIITIVLSGIAILGSLLGLTTVLTHFSITGLFGVAARLAISGWILWYMLQPNVGAAFSGAQAKAVSA